MTIGNIHTDNVEQIIKQDTGGNGIDAAFDGISGDILQKGLRCLRPRGHLLTYGRSGGPAPAINWPPSSRSIYLSNHTGADYNRPGAQAIGRASEIFAWVRDGRLKVHIHKEYALADAVQAHRDLESRETIGKLLLVP